jgi:hypothetical protein
MARSKRKWPVILGVAFVAIVLGALFYTSGESNRKFRCEVCITFDGRTVCRNGAAPTQMEAERIASDTACTDLSSGMTSLLQCQNNAPRKVTWK